MYGAQQDDIVVVNKTKEEEKCRIKVHLLFAWHSPSMQQVVTQASMK